MQILPLNPLKSITQQQQISKNNKKYSNINTHKNDRTALDTVDFCHKSRDFHTKFTGIKPIIAFDVIPGELENAKELPIIVFKKYGKFEKGNAILKGKPYTGTITTEPNAPDPIFNNAPTIRTLLYLASPPKAQLTYENGYLVKSLLSNGTEKIYDRINGKIYNVRITNPENPAANKNRKMNRMDTIFLDTLSNINENKSNTNKL